MNEQKQALTNPVHLIHTHTVNAHITQVPKTHSSKTSLRLYLNFLMYRKGQAIKNSLDWLMRQCMNSWHSLRGLTVQPAYRLSQLCCFVWPCTDMEQLLTFSGITIVWLHVLKWIIILEIMVHSVAIWYVSKTKCQRKIMQIFIYGIRCSSANLIHIQQWFNIKEGQTEQKNIFWLVS